MSKKNLITSNTLPFGSKESHFLADIYSHGELLGRGIRSKLIYNEIKYTKPLLFIYPSEETGYSICHSSDLEVKGFLERVGGEKAGEIHIPKAYVNGLRCTHRATSWEECVIEIEPWEIYNKLYLGNNGEAKSAKCRFFLTGNKYVKPHRGLILKYTGDVRCETESMVVLNLGDGWSASFEEHFHYIDAEIEEIAGYFSSSCLVLTLQNDMRYLSSIGEMKNISDIVDILLWYLSFGTRQRTTWVKWVAAVGNEHVEYYRKIGIPENTGGYEVSLVDEGSIKNFLQYCLEYVSNRANLDLYLPIVYLVNSNSSGKTVESQFVLLYMALEALLNLFAKDGNKKTKVLFSDFCKKMRIDNSDLWPMYGSRYALSAIRDQLVHGKRFKYERFIGIAKIHLRWTVERCLLAALGWKGDADVDNGNLRAYPPYLNWRSYLENE